MEEGQSKGKKRKRNAKPLQAVKFSEAVFRVNGDTEGGVVKGRNEVLKNRILKVEGRQPHVNCRVETLGLIMRNFDEKKLQWVKEIGMGALLFLIGKSLPRGLCYWLMTRVDHLKKVFIYAPGCEYPLDRSQVHWVLGLPHGPNVVPRGVQGERMAAFVETVFKKYGVVTDKGSRYISMQKVMAVVEGDCGHEQELEFKEAFLALALCDVLCPTTCLRLGKDLIPALSVVRDALSYDWCDLVLEKLLWSCRQFAQKFYRDGFVSGVGGCTYFLAILYLDRLKRPPVKWGMFPRVKAWTETDVSEAKAEDKLNDLPASDFGKLEFIDVAYGERHPKASRDTMGPQSLGEEVARHVLVGLGVGQYPLEPETVVEIRKGRRKGRVERRKGPADGSNPFLRKLAKRCRSVVIQQEGAPLEENCVEEEDDNDADEVDAEMNEVNSAVEGAIRFGVEEDGDVLKHNTCGSNYLWSITPDDALKDDDVGDCNSHAISGRGEDESLESHGNVEAGEVVQVSGFTDVEDGMLDEGKMCRSKPRRGTKPSAKLLDKDFDVEVVPRHNPKQKARLVKFVCMAGAILKDESRLEQHERTQEDVVMLRVGDMYASLLNCYSVAAGVHGGVDDNYVRAAGALYKVVWKQKFGDSGMRYMVDPTFAMRVNQEIGPPSGWNTCRRLCKTYMKDFPKKTVERVHVVFVPVLEFGHWWCAGFCINTEEIWIIDSAAKDPVGEHQDGIWKLCVAMDIFLSMLDFTWVPGKLECWMRKPVMMEAQADGNSCGVRMLLAIKACASRYYSEYRLPGDIEEERGWLLNDDLMNDANEVKDQVKQIINTFDG